MASKKSVSDETIRKVEVALNGVPDRIKRARKAAGKTQEQIALRAGLAPVTLSKIEIGKNVPSLETLLALAYALDASPNDILSWHEAEDPTDRAKALQRLMHVSEQLSESWLETITDLASKAAQK